MGKLVRDDRKATVTQITTRYNQRWAQKHFIYLFSHLADAFIHSDLQMRKL